MSEIDEGIVEKVAKALFDMPFVEGAFVGLELDRIKARVAIAAYEEATGLRNAAKLALYEMCHTVAPRNSFTDAVDALDAALNAKKPAPA
jgi:hypothetical protein